MADENAGAPETPETTAPEGVDLGAFVPDDFMGEDGAYDTAGFRARYDEMVSAAAQAAEARGALPEDAGGYEFALPDDFQLPEGFDADALKHTDDHGNEIAFDAASMIDANDPDIPVAQGIMHQIAQGEISPMDGFKKVAGLMVGRELRGVMEAQKAAGEEMKALGPDGKTRISNVVRSLNTRLPEAQAKALADSITSADALRGFETLVKKAGATVPQAPGGKSAADMTIDERLAAGLKQRAERRA